MLWLPLVIGAGLVLTVFQAHLREEQPAWAVLVGLSFVAVIILVVQPQFAGAFGAPTALAREAQESSLYLNPVLKTMGSLPDLLRSSDQP